jgi:hypothetical protein
LAWISGVESGARMAVRASCTLDCQWYIDVDIVVVVVVEEEEEESNCRYNPLLT